MAKEIKQLTKTNKQKPKYFFWKRSVFGITMFFQDSPSCPVVMGRASGELSYTSSLGCRKDLRGGLLGHCDWHFPG
jgi:hypothetical protein